MDEKNLFPGDRPVPVRALLVGTRLDLKALEGVRRLGTQPLVIEVDTDAVCVLFRYGAVVIFGGSALEEARLLALLRPHADVDEGVLEHEQAELIVRPDAPSRAADGEISVQRADIETIQLVAEGLARSVALAWHEEKLAKAIERVEPLASKLRTGRHTSQDARELLRHIGDSLVVEHRVVGRVEVREKPELLWDEPDLEKLWSRLSDEYELVERDVALERKVDLIARTAGTLLGIVDTERSLRLERWIVALIVIEIVLLLFEIFVLG